MAEPIHNQFPSRDPESSTQPRYSLSYDLIGSSDTLVNHVSGPVRIVNYEASDGRSLKVREALSRKGLILGADISASSHGVQTYRVPKSARPISYDARVRATGAFSYNDEQLFFDMGNLLGNLYSSIDQNSVAIGDIGRAIAFVEFTEPNERQLYFVPGIEKIVETLDPRFSPLDYYVERFSTAFDGRFDEYQEYLTMGFTEAVDHAKDTP